MEYNIKVSVYLNFENISKYFQGDILTAKNDLI